MRRKESAFSELEKIYQSVDAEIQNHTIECRMCGKCCNFSTNEMRLYIFQIERLYLQSRLGKKLSLRSGCCSGQQGNTCDIHQYRPIGCRTQFCTYTFQDIYEKYAREIAKLERRHDIPYIYQDAFE